MSGSSNGEQKGARTRVTNGTVRPMYNDDAFNSDLDSPVEDQSQSDLVMRVGKDYQVKVPDMVQDTYDTKHEALLVWQPCELKISNSEVDEFCQVARDKHKYSEEQALGMLFWHKHDVEKALIELANFAPFPDDWSTEDKVLFEQAFSYHGKSFHRIREMLPDKSIAALVRYYYGWKKVRSRPSVMDRQAKQAPIISDILSDLSDESDSNSEKSEMDGEGPACVNCSSKSSSVEDTHYGKLCRSCYDHVRRAGVARPFALFKRNSEKNKDSSLMPQRFNPTKNRKRPPKGIYMDEEDLKLMAAGDEEHQEALINNVRVELALLKSQVQTNKQHISLLKGAVQESIDEFNPTDAPQARPTNRWSQEELLLAVQGVRTFGRNFQAIAQVLGTKNTTQVRAFFSAYKKRYNLDGALAEYEALHKTKAATPEPVEEDDIDNLMPLTPPPLVRMPPSPSQSPSTHKGKHLPTQAMKSRSSPKPKPYGALPQSALTKASNIKS